jgi:hypothetical protein
VERYYLMALDDFKGWEEGGRMGGELAVCLPDPRRRLCLGAQGASADADQVFSRRTEGVSNPSIHVTRPTK